MDTRRRLTTGPERDNLAAIIAAIQHEALCAYERAELLAGTLDTRTALGFVLTQALDELASYWPEISVGLLELRSELPWLNGDARPVQILRHAAQTIVQLRQDIEQLQGDFEREAAELQAEIARRQAAPHYDWSNPPPVLAYQGNDADGNPILAAAADDKPVGVTVAALDSEAEE